MKKNGLNTIRIGLIIGIVVMAGMLIGTSSHATPQHTSGHVIPMVNGANLTTPLGENSTLFAYIYGQPTAINPFSGYSIADQSSPMPPSMTIVVHSFGNSTVQVTWSGSSPAGITEPFAWRTEIPFSHGQGLLLVEITIYSYTLKQSISQEYTLNVMNYTEYISYENQQNPVKSTVLEPWYVQYEAAEAGAILAAIMVTIYYFYSQIQWDNREKKQKLFDVE